MTGPNPIYEELVHATRAVEHAFDAFRPRHTSAETTAAAPTITPMEDRVSLLTEAKTALHDGITKLETLDEDALNRLETVQAHPEALDAFNTLAELAGLGNLPSGVIATATGVLKALGAMVPNNTPAQPAGIPQAVPSGPVVAGQA